MDIKRLILVVAERHNLLLNADDPILVTVTLNEAVLEEYVSQVKAVVDEAFDSVEDRVALQVDRAAQAGQEVVSIAAAHASRQIRDVGLSVVGQLMTAASDFAAETESRRAELARVRAHVRWAALAAWLGVAATVGLGLLQRR